MSDEAWSPSDLPAVSYIRVASSEVDDAARARALEGRGVRLIETFAFAELAHTLGARKP